MSEKPPGPVRRNARHFILGGVDVGDGRRRKVRLTIDREGVEVRIFHSRKLRWFVPPADAAGLLARRGQVREAERVLRGRRVA